MIRNNFNLDIKVFPSASAEKPLLHRNLFIHPDIDIPYNMIVLVCRFLFGKQCVVVFTNEFIDS